MGGVRGLARGMTLVELMLGLAITTVIGGAIVAMLFAVSRGADEDTDLRSLVARGKRVHAASTAALRGSRELLDIDSQRLVLWYRDADDDGRIDADELRAIDYAADASELRWYEPTDTVPDAEHEASADFLAVVDGLIESGGLAPRTWAGGVAGFSLALDEDEPAAAKLASYRLILREGRLEHEAVAAVAMRNR